MKKQVFLRAALGAPLGIALGTLIALFGSFVAGLQVYLPCHPDLVQAAGSELAAIAWQTLLCALLGAVFAGGSVIWQVERWGLTRQTLLYFLLGAAVMLPTAYVCRWMPHSLGGVLQYLAIFAAIFAGIWLCLYLTALHSVRQLNHAAKKTSHDHDL